MTNGKFSSIITFSFFLLGSKNVLFWVGGMFSIYFVVNGWCCYWPEMTSPTRSPFSNPFKIRRRGSLFSPQAAYWTHAAARIPPQYMNSFHLLYFPSRSESFPLLSTALHLQDLHKTSGDPGLPAALTEDLDDPVLRDSPKVFLLAPL
ncbi:hypothetical protein J6590_083083 [Homalodisca vitripennis]|nr:hypothetical protein J6590_083083 [Homalodisca vitripennis]